MSVVASVVIPARDAQATLGRQLQALGRQRGNVPFEVVVVANRCRDRTVEVARSVEEIVPHLVVVTADARPSAAYARNVGVRHSRGDFLLFCDADDEVNDVWVESLVAGLAEADLVGGRWEIMPSPLPRWLDRLPGTLRGTGDALTLFDGRFWCAPTACLGCRRTTFDAVGGFDERFTGAAVEDFEFNERVLTSGGHLGLAPDASIRYWLRTTCWAVVSRRVEMLGQNAEILASRGHLERPNLMEERKRLVKRLAHELVRVHNFDPRFHAALIAISWRDLNRRRRLVARAAPSMQPDEPTEAVLPPRTPVVGGRAFRTSVRHSRWWATKGVDPLSINALTRLLPAGGSFVDVGANIGVFTVAAALIAGPTGHVRAVEPDRLTRQLLAQNVGRHGVDDRVTVSAKAAFDSIEPLEIDVVRIGDAGRERDVLDGCGMLLGNPNLSIMCEFNGGSVAPGDRDINSVLDKLSGEGRCLLVPHANQASPSFCRARSIDEALGWLALGDGDSPWHASVLAVPPTLASRVEGLSRLGPR